MSNKNDYSGYAYISNKNTIQPGGLLPIVSQGCKSSIGKRQFTSYIPNCKMNQIIRKKIAPEMGYQPMVPNAWGNTPRNREYRLFLQKNGLKIMTANSMAAALQATEYCHCPNKHLSDQLYQKNEYPNFNPYF